MREVRLYKLSFKHCRHSHDTFLSKYIWDLKDGNTDFSIKWSIVTPASSYREIPSRRNLCHTEKPCVLSSDRSTLKTNFMQANRSRIALPALHELVWNLISTTTYGIGWWPLPAWNSRSCELTIFYNIGRYKISISYLSSPVMTTSENAAGSVVRS